MSRMRQLLAISILLSLLTPLAVISTPGVSAAAELAATSAAGERAYEDLRRCVNTEGVLNVYYLVDESRSLRQTDGQDKRAKILGNSLRQLVRLTNNESLHTDVNFAVGFFARKFQPWQSWMSVSNSTISRQAAALEQEVKSRDGGDATNWLAGINGARAQLDAQSANAGGCSTLIWLTDGEIDLDTTESADQAALDKLCNTTADGIRKSKIVVLGVLLQSTSYLASKPEADREVTELKMSWMRPIVEGSGTLADGTQMSCGQSPIPQNFSGGAMVVATDPLKLAFQFAVISEQIDCGNTQPLAGNSPTTINIDPGINRFTVVTTDGNAQLTRPDGTDVDVPALAASSAGVSSIPVAISADNPVGQWTLTHASNSSNSVVMCNGLGLKLNPGQLVDSRPGLISGKVVAGIPGAKVNLSQYVKKSVQIQEIRPDGTASEPVSATLSKDNTFKLDNFKTTPGRNQIEVRVTLNTSTKHMKLAPVSITQVLKVMVADHYPEPASDSTSLSDLVGKDGKAAGTLDFKSGSVGGKVCLTENPQIVSDSVDRADQYSWTVAGLDKSGCADVPAGETKQLQVQASNPHTFDGSVIAKLDVTYYSDDDPDKPLVFPMSLTFDTAKAGQENAKWWRILFFILGILIPLLIMYLIAWLTTKILVGNQLQRAQFPVIVTPAGIKARDGQPLAVADGDFKWVTAQPNARLFADPGVGQLRAKVSKLVFPSPWYEAVATPGQRLITKQVAPARLRRRFAAGDKAVFNGDLGDFWALRMDENDLAVLKGQEVPATLVTYVRIKGANVNGPAEAVAKVAATPGLWKRIEGLSAVARTSSVVPNQVAPSVTSGIPTAPVAPIPGATPPANNPPSAPPAPGKAPGSGLPPPPPTRK